jgi:hypothetical protein
VWGIVAANTWRLRRELGRRSGLFRVVPALAVVVALHHVSHALIELTPTQLDGRLPALHAVLQTRSSTPPSSRPSCCSGTW